jgi:DNA ligase-1
MNFDPMLARSATLSQQEISSLTFPVVASPKLDGMRIVKIGGSVYTRNGKPLANVSTRVWLETHLPNHIDGELCLPKLTEPLEDVMSAFRSSKGTPEFKFAAFDCFEDESLPFGDRIRRLANVMAPVVYNHPDRVLLLRQTLVKDEVSLRRIIGEHLEAGFEGTMVRAPLGRYKQGRSTWKEQGLLKIKPFDDEEATILGLVEEMANTNEERTAIGRRSTSACGLVAKGRLGAFSAQFDDGTLFTVGGFTDKQKAEFWALGDQMIGKRITVKHQVVHGGRKPGQAPRHPQFKCVREEKV